ncbi:MAG: indolepyruvate ferredoxin oxidoreductase [Candidatus Cloacimonetes bacterium 4572_55]|nr:MAG: indolepyruvate ferredoxin oxidoreductase [Candidatus Cloacimonetes bacterium 4572_55]
MPDMVLLGDEAVAVGAIHSGLSVGYAYPGTPSTEIMEYLIQYSKKHDKPLAYWCVNEKTSYEEALGVSFAGKRTMVSMKHVGLNVAADPFVNSAILSINGGVVLVVADDPGMHSSQNEQDSRYFADFARIICLEPANQQEAYEMTREAFDLSEKFKIPVMVRLVTRLAHSRSVVQVREARAENEICKVKDSSSWILLPSNARRQWSILLDQYDAMKEYCETTSNNPLTLNTISENDQKIGVITTGISRNYFIEVADELDYKPSHLHISAYPLPYKKIRKLAESCDKVIILEEGYPYLERFMRGILDSDIEILGKESGHVPITGELNPDNIRPALGLPKNDELDTGDLPIVGRPPMLCKGCPHADSFDALKKAMEGFDDGTVTSDIGCYTLGALPPYSAVETCVNMGASISVAKGASEAGLYPVLAVIGDSTFLHSGVTPLIDAVAGNTDMTLLIMDNEGVAMTGGQPTMLPSSRIEQIVLGVGVDSKHFHVVHAHKKDTEKNAKIIRKEIEYHGLSVIIAVRECIEITKRLRKEKKA